ncbi:hypothetical protein MNV49_001214 [Pseudohyphozyma bogoriensis]|nr:hypothetical protein MNV49_001214 [Pseudohyphozyma bogoriensis]
MAKKKLNCSKVVQQSKVAEGLSGSDDAASLQARIVQLERDVNLARAPKSDRKGIKIDGEDGDGLKGVKKELSSAGNKSTKLGSELNGARAAVARLTLALDVAHEKLATTNLEIPDILPIERRKLDEAEQLVKLKTSELALAREQLDEIQAHVRRVQEAAYWSKPGNHDSFADRKREFVKDMDKQHSDLEEFATAKGQTKIASRFRKLLLAERRQKEANRNVSSALKDAFVQYTSNTAIVVGSWEFDMRKERLLAMMEVQLVTYELTLASPQLGFDHLASESALFWAELVAAEDRFRTLDLFKPEGKEWRAKFGVRKLAWCLVMGEWCCLEGSEAKLEKKRKELEKNAKAYKGTRAFEVGRDSLGVLFEDELEGATEAPDPNRPVTDLDSCSAEMNAPATLFDAVRIRDQGLLGLGEMISELEAIIEDVRKDNALLHATMVKQKLHSRKAEAVYSSKLAERRTGADDAASSLQERIEQLERDVDLARAPKSDRKGKKVDGGDGDGLKALRKELSSAGNKVTKLEIELKDSHAAVARLRLALAAAHRELDTTDLTVPVILPLEKAKLEQAEERVQRTTAELASAREQASLAEKLVEAWELATTETTRKVKLQSIRLRWTEVGRKELAYWSRTEGRVFGVSKARKEANKTFSYDARAAFVRHTANSTLTSNSAVLFNQRVDRLIATCEARYLAYVALVKHFLPARFREKAAQLWDTLLKAETYMETLEVLEAEGKEWRERYGVKKLAWCLAIGDWCCLEEGDAELEGKRRELKQCFGSKVKSSRLGECLDSLLVLSWSDLEGKTKIPGAPFEAIRDCRAEPVANASTNAHIEEKPPLPPFDVAFSTNALHDMTVTVAALEEEIEDVRKDNG